VNGRLYIDWIARMCRYDYPLAETYGMLVYVQPRDVPPRYRSTDDEEYLVGFLTMKACQPYPS